MQEVAAEHMAKLDKRIDKLQAELKGVAALIHEVALSAGVKPKPKPKRRGAKRRVEADSAQQ